MRRINIGRQLTQSLSNLIAHITGCIIQVDIQIEFDRNYTATLVTGRGNGSDTLNTINGLFERFGNLTFYDIGVGSGIVGTDCNVGRIDGRIFTKTEVFESNSTKNNNDDAANNGKYRAF